MRIMIKHTLKNIFSKPLRTLLLFVCIASCSFSALLCIDMSGSMEYLVKNLLTQAKKAYQNGNIDDANTYMLRLLNNNPNNIKLKEVEDLNNKIKSQL